MLFFSCVSSTSSRLSSLLQSLFSLQQFLHNFINIYMIAGYLLISTGDIKDLISYVVYSMCAQIDLIPHYQLIL